MNIPSNFSLYLPVQSRRVSRASFTRPGSHTRAMSSRGGFTLVEAMISMIVLAFIALSIFSGLILAYRTSAHTRYRDHARYVLKSIGDQFLTRQAENAGIMNPLFTVTSAPTGTGIIWQGTVGTSANAATGLKVTLGETTGALIEDAVITREVSLLNSSGEVDSVGMASSAGVLLQGKFKITYTFNNIPVEQSLSLVRRVP